MQPEERDPAYLWDMLEAGRAILRFCEGKTLEDYRRDELLRAGVEREFILVGEGPGASASRSVPSTITFPGGASSGCETS